jgi:hypothetical protein
MVWIKRCTRLAYSAEIWLGFASSLEEILMRLISKMLTAMLLCSLAHTASALEINQGFLGDWTLDLKKSAFGPDGAPVSGMVSWTEHGWVFAMGFEGGSVYADAVSTDEGCVLIGVPSDYQCTIEVVTANHIRFTLKQGSTVRRVGEIELTDPNTTRTTHRVTPAKGAPYIETTIWVRNAR